MCPVSEIKLTMSTKHKPGIVGVWMHMVFQEKLNSDTNHKLQSVCRKKDTKKNSRSQINRTSMTKIILSIANPHSFSPNGTAVVSSRRQFCMQRLYLWATEMCQTFLQRLWPSKPSDWHTKHELHPSSLLFAWGLGCFWMKISCWTYSQLSQTWIRNVIGKKHLQWLRGFRWQLKIVQTSDVLATAMWSSGRVVSRYLTSFSKAYMNLSQGKTSEACVALFDGWFYCKNIANNSWPGNPGLERMHNHLMPTHRDSQKLMRVVIKDGPWLSELSWLGFWSLLLH